MIHNLSVLRFIPSTVNPLPVLSHSPGFLDEVPDRVGEIVVDVADDVDDADQESEERIHEPGVGHVPG